MYETYKHVVIFGVDGAGHFIREADTPSFDRIFVNGNGAYTYDALTANPPSSAECWASMMTGVQPKLHKRDNEKLRTEKYPVDGPYPTIFRRIREADPDAELGAFCEWTPIIRGLVEANAAVMCCSDPDYRLMDKTCRYIRKHRPTLLYIHCDSCDHEGHLSGYGEEAQLKQIHTVDGYLGQVYDAVRDAGMLGDTLFLMVCDHGGTCYPREDNTGFWGVHGGWTDDEKLITFGALGKTVVPGYISEMTIRDIAAIVLHAFNMPIPCFDISGWTAQIPKGLFKDISSEYISVPHA